MPVEVRLKYTGIRRPGDDAIRLKAVEQPERWNRPGRVTDTALRARWVLMGDIRVVAFVALAASPVLRSPPRS